MDKKELVMGTEPEIDPAFNMSLFERLLAFIKELLAKILGYLPKF